MGTLTLAEMRSELLVALGNRDDITAAQLNRWINLSQIRIARTRTWKEMRVVQDFSIAYTGVAETDSFTPFVSIWPTRRPKVIYDIRIIDGTSSLLLHRRGMKERDYFNANPAGNSPNKPVSYLEWQDKLEWAPVPNKAYTARIRAALWPAILSADTATSDLDDKDDLIIKLAENRALRSLKNHEAANLAYGEYRTMLEEAILADAEKPDWTPIPTRIRSGAEPFSGDAHLNPWVKEIR